MATTEERVDKLEVRFSTLEQQFAATMARVDSLVEESKQQRDDIRQAQAKHEADMRDVNARIDANYKDFTKQLHNNFVQTMLGVGAIMAAIGGLIIATLK